MIVIGTVGDLYENHSHYQSVMYGAVPVAAELRRLGCLAGPIILTQVSQMGMGVVDVTMAGRVGAVDLAGVALGGNFFWPSMLFLSGVIMAITPSVSQLHGSGRCRDAGELFRQAMWVVLVGGGTLIAAFHLAAHAYEWMGVDERAIPVAVSYLSVLSWGLIPLLTFLALRCLCDGMNWTLPAMLIACSGLALKVPLNLLFVFGQPSLGVPALGGVGCAWASAIVVTCECVAMVLVVALSRMRVCAVFARLSWPDLRAIGRLVRLGVPIGVSIFLEVGLFAGITLMIGRLGAESVAAHQIAANIGGVTFMIPLALGMAASIRVGYNVGSGDLAAARLSGWVAIGTSLAFACVAAIVVFLFRDTLVGLYTHDATVAAVAGTLLLFVVCYQFFDDAQVTVIGALRGYKDTATPMWVALLAYWCVALPLGARLAFEGMGVYGFWWGLMAGLCVAAVALVCRYGWLTRNERRIGQLAVH